MSIPRCKSPADLRSARWFAPDTVRGFGHRSRAKQMGYAAEDFKDKPVIAILNTWSDLNTCHTHFKERVEEVKRGVWQAGGFPVEIPVMSLSEMFMKPTTMLYRNLLAMEVEEVLRCHPVDGAVLMGGCDKTVPALIMGATTMNIPAIFLPAGPMLRGNWRGTTLGSGSDVWKYWAERRAGRMCDGAWCELEDGIARSPGVCMTMGTAATMACIAEALGLTLPGAASIPAVDSNHARLASACGRRIVAMVWEDLKPRDILTPAAFDNAITIDMAIGGSTNAIIHLLAMARRAGVELDLSRFDEVSRRTPWLANLRPSGKYLMEDFHYAGGLRGLMGRMPDLLNLSCVTVNGATLGENLIDEASDSPLSTGGQGGAGGGLDAQTARASDQMTQTTNNLAAGKSRDATSHDTVRPTLPQPLPKREGSQNPPAASFAPVFNDDVIRPRDNALAAEGGTFVLRGNLAPDGAVIKVTAAEKRLLTHRGPAIVFRDYNDLEKRIDDEALPVTPDSVLVLQSAGPLGAPGMPEWGQLPIPKKLLKQGVRDMLRISDARMSGTSYGACVLHVSPESAAGGPIALVRDGDLIELNAPARTLTLHVTDAELAQRRAAWQPQTPRYERGYGELFLKHVTQAHLGCDFDFLDKPGTTREPEIH